MTAASDTSDQNHSAVDWYYLHDGVPVGPLAEGTLLQAARSGDIQPDTLVWQQAFDRWREAATIPMVAVNLGCDVMPIAADPEPLPRRAEQEDVVTAPEWPSEQPEEPAWDASAAPQELNDALTDEEAAEPVLDVEQFQELLKRTSRFPADRSIPPASVTSSSAPSPMKGSGRFAIPQLVGFTGAALLIVAVAFVFVRRVPEAHSEAPAVVAVRIPSAASAVATPRTELSPAGSKPELAAANSESKTDAAANSESKTDAAANSESKLDGVLTGGTKPETVVVTSGSLEVQLFLAKLQRASRMFDEQCWEKYRGPGAEAVKNPSVRVEMSIDRSGRVYDVTSTKAPLGYRGAGLCIIGRMRGWKFPRQEQGSHATVIVERLRHP